MNVCAFTFSQIVGIKYWKLHQKYLVIKGLSSIVYDFAKFYDFEEN